MCCYAEWITGRQFNGNGFGIVSYEIYTTYTGQGQGVIVMGYAMMMSNCFVCNQLFTYNPICVPSFRDSNSVRQPICRMCIDLINVKRVEEGLEEFVIHLDAYEGCDESELG